MQKVFFIAILCFSLGFGARIFLLSLGKRDIQRTLAAVIASCLAPTGERTERITCIKNNISRGVSRYGVRPYMDALGALMDGKGGQSTEVLHCHDIAHVIGKLGVANAKAAQTALSSCTRLCGDGCYHGVVEGYLSQGKDLDAAIQSLCPSKNESCFHGLGHGIATIIVDVRKSLGYCDKIDSSAGREQCGYGVLMELYESSTFGHSPTPLPKDIVGFCKSLWEPYVSICNSKAGIHEYLRSTDAGAAGKLCEAVPETKECVHLLGALFYWQFQQSPQGLVEACKKSGVLTYEMCMTGAIEESANIDPRARRGFAICAEGSKEFRVMCFARLTNIISTMYSRDRVIDVVSSFCPNDGKDPLRFSDCLAGTGHGLFIAEQQSDTGALVHALDWCDKLSDEAARKTCYNGAIMEYNFHTAIDASLAERQISVGQPYTPCDDLASKYEPNCYFSQAQLWHSQISQDYQVLGKLCASIQEERNRQECFSGIGRTITDSGVKTDDVRASCGQMPTAEGVTFCLTESIRELLTKGVTDAPTLCETLSGDNKRVCIGASKQFLCHVMRQCR